MAFETDLVLSRSSPQLLRQESTMLVVTIRASHQSLLYAMAERTIEILFDICMASVAKLGLLVDQQELAFLRVVG